MTKSNVIKTKESKNEKENNKDEKQIFRILKIGIKNIALLR